MNKALELLQANRTVKERAAKYIVSIQRDLQASILDVLTKKKEKMEDDLFDLTNFTLDADLNAGKSQMTKAECEKRFKDAIELKYQIKLTEYEIDIKTKAFNEYFGETSK